MGSEMCIRDSAMGDKKEDTLFCCRVLESLEKRIWLAGVFAANGLKAPAVSRIVSNLEV